MSSIDLILPNKCTKKGGHHFNKYKDWCQISLRDTEFQRLIAKFINMDYYSIINILAPHRIIGITHIIYGLAYYSLIECFLDIL